jgi:hypothetical protein
LQISFSCGPNYSVNTILPIAFPYRSICIAFFACATGMESWGHVSVVLCKTRLCDGTFNTFLIGIF